MRPLVSAIVPTYDNERYVGECIESALAQSYPNLEVVVVDDCSSDATPRIVDGYARRFPDRVRFVCAETRAGPCRRRNDAIRHAQGDVLAWLDADDAWLPEKIERQVERLADDRVAFVYTDWRDVDAEGQPIAQTWPHVLVDGAILRELFVIGCFVCSSSAVFRRDVFEHVGGRLRDNDFSFGDDYDLWLRLSVHGQAACISAPLTVYRRHDRNESRRRSAVNFHAKRIELLREFLDSMPEARERLGRARRTGFARHRLRAARFEHAQRRLSRALAFATAGVLTDPRAAATAVIETLRPPRPPKEVAAPPPVR